MTAEERFKERFSEEYWQTKHDCKIQRFDYYDMVDFCQQSIDAELDLANKKVEELKLEVQYLQGCYNSMKP